MTKAQILEDLKAIKEHHAEALAYAKNSMSFYKEGRSKLRNPEAVEKAVKHYSARIEAEGMRMDQLARTIAYLDYLDAALKEIADRTNDRETASHVRDILEGIC